MYADMEFWAEVRRRVLTGQLVRAIVEVIELVASLKKGWKDAVGDAVREGSQFLRYITAVDVAHQRAHVEDEAILEYRVTVHVAFLVEHHSHLTSARAVRKE